MRKRRRLGLWLALMLAFTSLSPVSVSAEDVIADEAVLDILPEQGDQYDADAAPSGTEIESTDTVPAEYITNNYGFQINIGTDNDKGFGVRFVCA